MISFATLLAATVLGQPGVDLTANLIAKGRDEATGILVNSTVGAGPFDPIDPTRWTVAVVHGLNPYHPRLHFTIAERYAESIGSRYGSNVNVVGWDWNAATMPSYRAAIIRQNAIAQGNALGMTLYHAGVQPSSLHLVGHSSGCIIAIRAARVLMERTGQRVARITLLDPSVPEHRLIFEELDCASLTNHLEHVWVPGLSGFGRPVYQPGVANLRVAGPRGALGLLTPLHLDHFYAVGWHAREMGR
ncbi:thioesterase domain-containing protein [Singulisphaera rosea]